MSTIGEIIGPSYIEVAPEDTLGEVAEKMRARNVGAVVVKDFGRLIGILTERDMLRAMAARVHTSEARVRQWMTEDPITAAPDMTVEEAADVMLSTRASGTCPWWTGRTCSGSSACGVPSAGGGRRPASTPTTTASTDSRPRAGGGQAQAETTPLTRAPAAVFALIARFLSCTMSLLFLRISRSVCFVTAS